MEENGIGRPATYATVVSVLYKREYIEKDGKSMKPTELGFKVTEFMEKNFADIVNIKFTAEMEEKLDNIINGTEWQQIISVFYPDFSESVNKAYSSEKKVKLEEEVTDVVCEKCGAFMVVRNGRYGKFLGCPNYPKCKNIKNIDEVVGKCPRCGGEIVKRKTRTGKVFFGCGNYPTCDFMSWEIPAPIFCPACCSVMRIVTKEGKKQYICINKNCNNVVLPVEEAPKPEENE